MKAKRKSPADRGKNADKGTGVNMSWAHSKNPEEAAVASWRERRQMPESVRT